MVDDVKAETNRSQASDKRKKQAIGVISDHAIDSGIQHYGHGQQDEAEQQLILHVMVQDL